MNKNFFRLWSGFSRRFPGDFLTPHWFNSETKTRVWFQLTFRSQRNGLFGIMEWGQFYVFIIIDPNHSQSIPLVRTSALSNLWLKSSSVYGFVAWSPQRNPQWNPTPLLPQFKLWFPSSYIDLAFLLEKVRKPQWSIYLAFQRPQLPYLLRLSQANMPLFP